MSTLIHGAQTAVADFMRLIGTPVATVPGFAGRESLVPLEVGLIREEHGEVVNAILAGDIVETADGLGDLIYVCLNAANAFGIGMEPVLREIHRTNLEKANGPIRADGKRLKPPGWQPPRIRELLIAQRWDGR